MPTTCVLGTQWGDEGKARVVDLLADSADVIVRYQGGANAGHTVVFDGETYRLHMVPSGIFRKDKTCVVAHGVVVDAKGLLDEVAELRERGHEVGSNLVVSDRAHLVMPWHRCLDTAREVAKGAKKHGTTGRGIGPCYADKVSYRGIRVGDLYEEAWFQDRLRSNLEEKNPVLTKVHGLEPLEFDAILAEYREYAEAMAPFVGDAVTLLHEAMDSGKEILFEGAQGVLLDVDLGSYPYVTASNSCALGIPNGTGIPPTGLDRVIGTAKTYLTRVGAGPFPTEDTGPLGDRLREEGREFGTTTGRPRRCGWFDAVGMRYAVRSNGVTELALTKLDVLRGFDTLKICVAYERDGERITTMPATAAGLEAVTPVYRELPGFDEDVTGARSLEDLPTNARRFLDALQAEAGAPFGLVSVGPSREQVIRLDPPR
jgi:adenylosuccinate synthase